MIEYIEGVVQAVEEQKIVLRAGPVGLGIHIANGLRFVAGNTVSLYVYVTWHAEQGPALYGFLSTIERSVFIMATSCVGIGSKLGLAILEHLGAYGFLEAVQSGNEDALSSVNGIGAKKAEQIIVHCKHKVHKLIERGTVQEFQYNAQWHDVEQALLALHYSRSEIHRMLDQLRAEPTNTVASFDQLFRRALSYLALKQ
jgi:Holliday junction DNA helicase RuvA